MDDVFVERLISKKSGVKEIGIKVGAVILVLLAALLAFSFIPMLAPVIVVAVGWLGWILWNRGNVEFEYSLSNGELTIDTIFGQQKRKHLVELNIRERVELIAPVTEEFSSELNRTASAVYDASSSPNALGRYFINAKGETGLTRIFFEPDEKLLQALRRCAPSKVKGVQV